MYPPPVRATLPAAAIGRLDPAGITPVASGNGGLMSMNLDTYYRGLAGERLQSLGDELLVLSREAESSGAHDAAWHLSDLSTQLLDMGVQATGQHTDVVDDPLS